MVKFISGRGLGIRIKEIAGSLEDNSQLVLARRLTDDLEAHDYSGVGKEMGSLARDLYPESVKKVDARRRV